MDTAKIETRIGIRASTDAIWEVISNLPGWDGWNPIETGVSGTIAFGGDLKLIEAIEGLPERQCVARVGEWQPYAQLVWVENRGLWFRSVRYFEIEELEPGSCIAANGFIFQGLRGEMFFDKNRKHLRHAVDGVAEAWKAAAEA
ncbi:SRPBCC domain-containing protein [Brevundimonas sp. M20]|uniref:SRPBCC domain-containing protein n=1 Tax=Brevundimonas sp. M20 TaxID=2591463 RepID=UPI001146A6EF|nr:SRPBCC domain-containing protein [Brevundimonas sp. M20]QDH74620.1 SRPBCC domain-containing protein [Brevundimonas sp. M20]